MPSHGSFVQEPVGWPPRCSAGWRLAKPGETLDRPRPELPAKALIGTYRSPFGSARMAALICNRSSQSGCGWASSRSSHTAPFSRDSTRLCSHSQQLGETLRILKKPRWTARMRFGSGKLLFHWHGHCPATQKARDREFVEDEHRFDPTWHAVLGSARQHPHQGASDSTIA